MDSLLLDRNFTLHRKVLLVYSVSAEEGCACMTIFDLLFLCAMLASFVTLLIVLISLVRGRAAKALRILRWYAIGAVIYLLVGLAISLVRPQRTLRVGDPWCFDDWCLTVESVHKTPGQTGVTYKVDLRISSRAGRVAQRAKGAWIYLIDSHSRRFSPDPDPSAVPLDVELEPQESIQTTRTFRVPADAQQLGLITGHGGTYCGPMSFLVVGDTGCLFHKPSMVRID